MTYVTWTFSVAGVELLKEFFKLLRRSKHSRLAASFMMTCRRKIMSTGSRDSELLQPSGQEQGCSQGRETRCEERSKEMKSITELSSRTRVMHGRRRGQMSTEAVVLSLGSFKDDERTEELTVSEGAY